jgi:tRNA(adenine34) deaminase
MKTKLDDQYFMKIAIAEAEKALKIGDYPAGAVIVLNNKIITKASSTGITKKDPTAHAEINVIRKACKKLKSRFLTDCIIYASSEPCLMCAKAMVYARIKKVVYGTEHGEYGKKKTFDILKENGIGKDIEVVSGVGKKTAEEQLKRFLKKGIAI